MPVTLKSRESTEYRTSAWGIIEEGASRRDQGGSMRWKTSHLALLSLLSLAWAPPALAAPSESADAMLGRRNPYRPLILAAPSGAPSTTTAQPSARTAVSLLERLEFVGVAFDDAEAIAAVSDGERTFFVRKGDRVEGAFVSSITAQQLTLTQSGREIVKPRRQEGVF